MNDSRNGLTRRGFVKASAVTVGALSAGGLLSAGTAQAEDMPKVDESDPTAQGLKYVHDATQVDAGTRGGDDRICETCQLYTGEDGSEWGACTLFPKKLVAANGWCTAWAKRTG